jgi:cephalosporin-C deacetylase-like acetyl esterase
MKIRLGRALLLICFFTVSSGFNEYVYAQEDLKVLESWRKYNKSENFLYDKIAREAYKSLDMREKKLSLITSNEQWGDYINIVQGKLATAFGPFPEKTPLNAKITGVLKHEGVRIEKIIYESRPGFQVSSCLFMPSNMKGKLPAILYLCGHSRNGFKYTTYQHVILNLVKKGFVVFAIDPVGQGERIQYYDENQKKSLVGGPTNEHSYAGLQYLLLGRTMAGVRLWDAIRALDYLEKRPEVDTSRIGVLGASGGGTMSSYLGAMDSRIAASAPERFITGFKRLFQSIGPQDAEQNLIAQISNGLDHGDFLIARAPKPTLVVSTTQDFFSIQGAREVFSSVKPAFSALNAPDNIQMIEDDAGHASTVYNRERIYAFFMNTFGVDGDFTDENIPTIEEKKLYSTVTGQVVTSGSKSIYDCIKEDSRDAIKSLESSRLDIDAHTEKVKNTYISLSGFNPNDKTLEVIFTGRFQREGYTIERIIIDSEDEIPIPVLVFVPDGGGKFPAILYLDQLGKGAEAKTGGLLELYVRSGNTVIAPDLPGCGELQYGIPGTHNSHADDSVLSGVSYNVIFGAQLIGRSITGLQAESILRTLRYLVSREDVDASNVSAVSKGITGPALMHAAVYEKSINEITLIESPISWESILMYRLYDPAVGSTIVPSALLYYDLPDLLGMLSPRKIHVVNPVDGIAQPASENLIKHVEDITNKFYRANLDCCEIITLHDKKSLNDMLLKEHQ